MIIHVVQPGETIYSIASNYGKSVDRLIRENDLLNPNNLVVGQTIVIVYPKLTYIVKRGDTLVNIAKEHGVPLMQLLRNNPYLSDREYIYPGEEIVISYEDDKIGKIQTNGYAYPFIDINTLRKILPFLTFLSIFKYTVNSEGELNNINDSEIIQVAKEFGVAPVMIISALTETGDVDIDTSHNLLIDVEIQNRLINNIIMKMKEKGYYALNVDYQLIPEEDRKLYINFLSNLTNRLNSEGYSVIATLTPRTFQPEPGEDIYLGGDYAELSRATNGVILLAYSWGYTDEFPIIAMPFQMIQDLLSFAVTQINPDVIFMGITTIGYIWELPYVKGVSRVVSINQVNAIQLASDGGAVIYYDEITQASYFYYGDNNEYIVWFKDPRSVNNTVKLVPEYGLRGIGIWNVMYFMAQIMLVINVQYEIDKIYDEV